jgi:translation elongation factor EF-4
VQAQTMANFWLAYEVWFAFFVLWFCVLISEANLHILAAINKIDMKNAQTKNVLKQIEDTFGLKKESTLLVIILLLLFLMYSLI